MALIDNVSSCMYFTPCRDLREYTDREGSEGELFSRIAELLYEFGMSENEILAHINAAMDNCIKATFLQYPNFKVEKNDPFRNNNIGNTFKCLSVTYLLLIHQPEDKCTGGLKRVCDRLQKSLFDDFLATSFDGDDWAASCEFLAKMNLTASVDFSICPDMDEVKRFLTSPNTIMAGVTDNYDMKKVEFLIDLMRTKEDKLFVLDAIDEAHDKDVPDLPF